MRERALLKLDDIKECNNVTQNAILQVTDKGFEFGMEDTDDQIRAIRRYLAREKLSGYLRPGRIGSHSDKEITTSIIAVNGQCILTELLHVASASRKAGSQNHPSTQLCQVGISISSNRINQARINLSTKRVLMGLDIPQTLLLSNGPGLTCILLEKL